MGRTQTLGDRLAIALSSLCVIHCLATPLLLIILPSFGALFADSHELFHQIILFFVFLWGWRRWLQVIATTTKTAYWAAD